MGAEKDEFEGKQKELEGVVNPIMMKVYQAAGGGGMPEEGGMPGGGLGQAPRARGASRPTDEVMPRTRTPAEVTGAQFQLAVVRKRRLISVASMMLEDSKLINLGVGATITRLT